MEKDTNKFLKHKFNRKSTKIIKIKTQICNFRKNKASNLLSFQSELDKNLLQLLIDKIYTKLLKAVPLENLKAINVQNANCEQFFRFFDVHGRIHRCHLCEIL